MMGEWQPRETAPKNRGPILVWMNDPSPSFFHQAVVVYVPEFSNKQEDHFEGDEHLDDYWANCGYFPDQRVEWFDYWMPLPEPPANG